MSELPTYVLERVFDAPRELVWKTWTDPELLPRWYGPRVETIIHRLDLQPGGLWLLEMKMAGNSNYQRVEYTEVTPPERLVWLHSNADADWNVASNPMMAEWPRVLLTTSPEAVTSSTERTAAASSALPSPEPWVAVAQAPATEKWGIDGRLCRAQPRSCRWVASWW